MNGPILCFIWPLAQTPESRQLTTVIALLWLVIGLGAIVWVLRLWLRGWTEERWRREHRCLNCGYDLRGITDRCPECGTLLLPDQKPPQE